MTGVVMCRYGSHYSNVGTVAFYLVRLEPFTTVALALQVRCALCRADASGRKGWENVLGGLTSCGVWLFFTGRSF